jgi:hypothetical protein
MFVIVRGAIYGLVAVKLGKLERWAPAGQTMDLGDPNLIITHHLSVFVETNETADEWPWDKEGREA